MTPHAGRVPALPVFLDSAWPPLPRSSVPECTTMVRCVAVSFCLPARTQEEEEGREGRRTPMTLSWPMSLISLSVVEPCALPWPSVL
jgi:hypothetical protein